MEKIIEITKSKSDILLVSEIKEYCTSKNMKSKIVTDYIKQNGGKLQKILIDNKKKSGYVGFKLINDVVVEYNNVIEINDVPKLTKSSSIKNGEINNDVELAVSEPETNEESMGDSTLTKPIQITNDESNIESPKQLQMTIIEQNMESVDNIEKTLDSKVSKYNGFSEKHPMDYVSYNSNKEYFEYNHDSVRKTCKLPEQIIMFALDNTRKKYNNIVFFTGVSKQHISYQNKSFLVYVKDDIYFDIQHIINVLDIKNNMKINKYNQFKDKIVGIIKCQNEYGGYIFREMITEETMYNIILSSNSEFSKEFKKDVSKLLVDLRKSNNLTIKDDHLELSNKIKHNDEKFIETMKNKSMANLISITQSDEYNAWIDKILEKGRSVMDDNWRNKNVMYMFITSINDQNGTGKRYCKIGYSDDVLERIDQLKKEYDCEMYPLLFKEVKNRTVETSFHNEAKKRFSELYCEINVKNKLKTELYILTKQLYDMFETFDTNLENEQITLLRMKYEHKEKMKQYEEKMKLHELEMLRINLEMKKLEFEIAKSNMNK